MTLFKLLAIILTTYGSNNALPTNPLPYAESFKEVKLTDKLLTDERLSMAEDIPHLNDYRRQFSEIVHAAYHIAWYSVIEDNCNQTTTEDLYIKFLEDAAAEAISNATYVVGSTKAFIYELNEKTDAIQKLVDISCANDINERDCDEVIQNFVLNDPEKYAAEANILLIAGETTKIFNTNSDKFVYISKELDAHKYVIRRPLELKIVVEAFKKVIPVIISGLHNLLKSICFYDTKLSVT